MVDINKVKESNEQREAFNYYYKCGLEKSYAKTALKFKKSVSTIEKWGSQYNWQKRVSELESELRKKTQERVLVEQELDYKQRNLKILKRLILEGAKSIQDGTLKITAKILLEAMREEDKVRTGTDSTIQVNHRFELRGMSNKDIQRTIDEKVEKILGFKGMTHFKDLQKPINAEYKILNEKRKSGFIKKER